MISEIITKGNLKSPGKDFSCSKVAGSTLLKTIPSIYGTLLCYTLTLIEGTLPKMIRSHPYLKHQKRSSHRRCSVRKGVLRNFAKFAGKRLRPAALLRKRFWYRCFPVSFAKCLRTPFLQNTSGWLLLIKSLFRGSYPEVFCKETVQKNFVEFVLVCSVYLSRSLFLNIFVCFRVLILLKETLETFNIFLWTVLL